jgi:diguanylate cyclase (GGDEF)-like protein
MATLANTDPLTGLANRRRLMEQFEREFRRALRYGRPLSLVYLDLDGFKTINDHFGHMFGDEVLQGVGKSMLAVLRATDLLARVGGEEFALLLPETGMEGASNVANKLRRALNAYSAQLGPAVPPLTFSAGISQLHDADSSFEDMLARADAAQYLAKTSGKAQARTERDLPAIESAAT